MPDNSQERGKTSRKLSEILDQGDNGSSKQLALGDAWQCAELQWLVEAVLDDGGGVMFSRTRDGGALCVGFYFDNQRTKRYAADREQWLALLTTLGR